MKPWSVIFFLGAVFWASAARADVPAGQDPALYQIESLEGMKADSPEAYAQTLELRKASFKRRIEALDQETLERFRAYLEKEEPGTKPERLHYLKEHDPQSFDAYFRDRLERFKKYRREQPDRFQAFMKEHPRIRRFYEQL